MKKKYFTEEERKAAKREANKRFRENNPDYKAKWRTEHLDSTKESWRRYYMKHSDAIKEWNKSYREDNKEQIAEYKRDYTKTPKGRAVRLLTEYRREDKKRNRGECTLTADWIVEHIFSQPCAHCGETDWTKIGCNRLNNSLPHTPDNVEPCCMKCNIKLGAKEKEKPVYQYTLDGDLVKIWDSISECGRNGFNQGHVNACCLGKEKRKTHGGFIWKYEKEEVA